MFKFVAVVALLAVAAASPDPALISATPLAYSSGLAHGITSYSAVSPFYNSAPLVYSSSAFAYPGNYGYAAHLIKKRSAPLISSYYTSPLAYAAPLGTTYASASPAITYSTSYGAPLVHSSPLYSTAHFIKKRSASLIVPSASYISPATYSSSPLISAYSAYSAAAPIYSSPYYAASPYAYTQFIKK